MTDRILVPADRKGIYGSCRLSADAAGEVCTAHTRICPAVCGGDIHFSGSGFYKDGSASSGGKRKNRKGESRFLYGCDVPAGRFGILFGYGSVGSEFLVRDWEGRDSDDGK